MRHGWLEYAEHLEPMSMYGVCARKELRHPDATDLAVSAITCPEFLFARVALFILVFWTSVY